MVGKPRLDLPRRTLGRICVRTAGCATNGRTVPHWDTLMRLERGHTIMHYAKGAVRSLSEVIEPYRIARRPVARPGFDSVQPGYLVRVTYYDGARPVALDEIPVEWRSNEGGPFTRSGRA